MKKTLIYLFAAIAIVSAASCSKADLTPDNGLQDGMRVITLQFDNSEATKVALDGHTPKWEVGDQVVLINASSDETVTLTAEDIDAACNTVTLKTKLSGTVYAVYPASAYSSVNKNTDKFDLKIPVITDGTFKNAHIAIAKGEDVLTFKNAVALLKINTSGVDDLLGINITAKSVISGDVRVALGETVTATGETTYYFVPSKTIAVVPAEAGVQYVAVAPGTIGVGSEFTVIKNDNSWGQKIKSTATAVAANEIVNLGSISDWSLTFDNSGSLFGKFTVADNKEVRFAKGNLMATKNSSAPNGFTWSIADNQMARIGSNAGNTRIDALEEGDVIDLFGWSTNNTYYGISASISLGTYSGSFVDWGTALGSGSEWRTLNDNEWSRLTNGFYYDGDLDYLPDFNCSSINGERCYIFAPDGNVVSIADSYTSEEWKTASVLGFVCLPAAGCRIGSTVNPDHRYWSTTPAVWYDVSYIYQFTFTDDPLGYWNPFNTYDPRSFGCAVRLVTDVKYNTPSGAEGYENGIWNW